MRLAALLLACLGAPAWAACEGPSLLDRLAPAEVAELEERAATVPFGEGLLWRATRGEDRLLVAGTLHLPDPRHDATMSALAPAIASADLVLVEATPAEQDALSRGMVEEPELFFLTEGPTLPDLLGEEDWARVAASAAARGMPAFLVAKFRPSFLAMTLSLPTCATLEAATSGRLLPGLDGLVIEAAEEGGVPLAALESWDTVFALMGEATLEEELDALRGAVEDERLNEEAAQATVDLYFEGRIAAVMELWRLMATLLPEERAAHAAEDLARMEEGLLAGRNRAWIPVIEGAAEGASRIVVAAGAGHLPGEDGVLTLLEEAGWRVEPLAPGACCEGVWDAPRDAP